MGMSSSAAKVPTCVTLPPTLIERVDRIAEAEERSRSFIVARALRTFCDAIEPGADSSAAPEPAGQSGTAAGATELPPAASYSALHLAAVRRVHAVHDEREATARQHRERVADEIAKALKGTTSE